MAYDHGAFRVTNLERSIEFYTQKLGFEHLFTDVNEEHEEKYAFLSYQGARLELIETLGETYVPARPVPPYCPHLCFQTDNVERVIEVLRQNDIEILDGPNEIPGSEQWMYFMDPDMNVLEYIRWFDTART